MGTLWKPHPTQDQPAPPGGFGIDSSIGAAAQRAPEASREDSCPQAILKLHHPNSLDYRACTGIPFVFNLNQKLRFWELMERLCKRKMSTSPISSADVCESINLTSSKWALFSTRTSTEAWIIGAAGRTPRQFNQGEEKNERCSYHTKCLSIFQQ